MGEWTRDTPWRQGFILKAKSAEALGFARAEECDDVIVLVISHDCDLAADIEDDPNCEVIVGNRLDAPEKDSTDGKKIRLLHLTFTGGDTHIAAEFRVTNKRAIPKSAFADHAPAETVRLNPEEFRTLQLWLSARYYRAVVPDNFDRRVKDNKVHKKIDKILKRHGAHIIGLYFNLDGGKYVERTDADDAYALSAYVLYRSANDPDARRDAEAAAIAIEKAFRDRFCDNDEWNGIEIAEVVATSDEVMTVAQARTLTQWYSDYLSLGETPEDLAEPPATAEEAAISDLFARTKPFVCKEE